MLDTEAVLKEVIRWVKEVGKIQVEKMDEEMQIHTKTNEFDLVTEVDQLSEKMLMKFIDERYPNHSILTEESGKIDHASDYQWIIDPIDGTTNYAHGFPAFGISIALNHQDETILGVGYFPKLGELYYAVKGKGAYLNDNRIQVSKTKELGKSLLSTGFPYRRDNGLHVNLKYFEQLSRKVHGIRRTGSAAYDLCNVAAGRFDGYWEFYLNLWDIAAGKLLVEEAGGKVISTPKENNILIISGNNEIFDDLYEELKKIDSNEIQKHLNPALV